MYDWKLWLDSNKNVKVNIDVYKCSNTETSLYSKADTHLSDIPLTTTEATTTTTTKPSLLQNVLGENLYSSIKDYFVPTLTETEIAKPCEPQEEPSVDVSCELIKSIEFEVTQEHGIALLLCVVLTVVLVFWLLKAWVLWTKKETTAHAQNTTDNKIAPGIDIIGDVMSGETDTLGEDSSEQPPEVEQCQHQSNKSFVYRGIPLSYPKRTHVRNDWQTNVAVFLNNTTEKLFSKLDKLLLKGSLADQTQITAALATPRLARRTLVRRQRVGSSPSLPIIDSTEINGQQSDEKIKAWQTFKHFSKQINWKEPHMVEVDESKYNRQVQRLLHYYQRVCPIISDHWNTCALITNYTLFLLKTELKHILCSKGYRFVQFLPTGSASDGTKIGRPNQFDVIMTVQPPVDPIYVIDEDKKECLPPGQLLINVNLPNGASIETKETTGHVKIENQQRLCLSSKEFSRSANELIDASLQMLYTKSRTLMDKLSFQIKRSSTPSLTIAVDTKSLVGLGIPEIKICLIPALPLPMDGWYQPVQIYAMPLSEDYQYKHRPDINPMSETINPDYLWQIHFCDLDTSFMEGLELRMEHSGVDSCHHVCLMVLKFLLTRGSKNSLLDRGVFQSHHISTILKFLLLESLPHQWTVDKLGDRFSDVVHFLREAFRNGRLPNFFINNPHLTGKMPMVTNTQLLLRKRQHNLLSEIRQENLEKCLEYLEDSLRDSGLQECVKDEYSDDMWEYEFFVY